MKEAMWGVLILTLGLLGIVIIQIFQNITVTNDQTYFLLKEVTEASMYDSIDLAYYRTKGKIRIIEDKFVENLTRRFAESTIPNKEYNIRIHDIIEEPPKVSLSIGSYVLSLKGDKFNIAQSLDAIIETKYDKGEIEETEGVPIVDPTDPVVPEDPGEDEEENTCPKCEEGDPNCSKETQCITGDLKFKGWGTTNIPKSVCPTDPLGPKTKDVNYQSCVCGKWEDSKESITTNPTKTATDYSYTWNFYKKSDIRTIDVSDTEKAYFNICLTDLEIEYPNPNTSEGVICPPGGIKMVVGQKIVLTPVYVPSNAVNRGLTWTSSDKSITSVQYPLPVTIGPKGISKATVTALKKGTSTITAKSLNNITDTCEVEVLDWACPTTKTEMDTNSTKQATIKGGIVLPGMKWSIDNINIATINSTGLITSKDTATEISYKVNLDKLTTLVCPLKINATIPEDDDDEEEEEGETPITNPSGCTPGSISFKLNNTTAPTLCPQEFENPAGGGEKPVYSKIGVRSAIIKYCGYNGGYDYPDKATWDKTETKNYSLGTNTSFDYASGKYTMTYSQLFAYKGWSTDVGPYTSGVTAVTKTSKITGTLLDRDCETCKNLETKVEKPLLYIKSCPEELVAAASGVQLEYAIVPATSHKFGSWTTSNSNVVSVDSSGFITPKSQGEATITYTAKANLVDLKATCIISVFASCANTSMTCPTMKLDHTKTISIDPKLGGESKWSTSDSSVIKITDNTNTFLSSVSLDALGAGSSKIIATRRIDNCKKSCTITIKQEYECPSGYNTEYPLNTDYCYNSKKPAPFACPSGYPFKATNGQCYKSYSDWSYGSSDYKTPNSCSPWSTGYVSKYGECFYLSKKVAK